MPSADDPAAPQNKARTRESARQLRRILVSWDPIGIAGAPEAEDEYDGLISPLLHQLSAGAQQADLEAWLVAQLAGMGLIQDTTARETRLAADLLVWWRSRVAAPGNRPGSTNITVRWPLETLELCVLRGVAGSIVGSDQLIAAGLDALLAGADSPALRQLAGLTRSEEPDAHDLFDQTVDELGIASTLPRDPTAASWELVRRRCQMIVDGRLAPELGARLIEAEGPPADDNNHPIASVCRSAQRIPGLAAGLGRAQGGLPGRRH
jgi:hypothetical protein